MTDNPVAALGSPTASENDFKIYTARPNVRFLSRAVQPPSQVYVDIGADIVVACASSTIGEVITVSYRLLRFDGELVLGQFNVNPASDRSIKTYSESLTEGFLLSVSCRAKVANRRGITFMRIFLTDPALGPGQPSYMLMADYVTQSMAPAYPGGRVLSPTEGPGVIYPFTLTNPAPGSDWSVTVPTNAVWRVQTIFAQLTTSGVAATRLFGVNFSDGVHPIYQQTATDGEPAGQTFLYVLGAGVQYRFDTFGHIYMPLPNDFTIGLGERISSFTALLQVGDQYSNVTLWIEEWLENV